MKSQIGISNQPAEPSGSVGTSLLEVM